MWFFRSITGCEGPRVWRVSWAHYTDDKIRNEGVRFSLWLPENLIRVNLSGAPEGIFWVSNSLHRLFKTASSDTRQPLGPTPHCFIRQFFRTKDTFSRRLSLWLATSGTDASMLEPRAFYSQIASFQSGLCSVQVSQILETRRMWKSIPASHVASLWF